MSFDVAPSLSGFNLPLTFSVAYLFFITVGGPLLVLFGGRFGVTGRLRDLPRLLSLVDNVPAPVDKLGVVLVKLSKTQVV